MRGAHRDADRNLSDAELADSMDCCNPDSGVLDGDAFEHEPHLLVRKTLMSFVVEPGDLLSVGVITDDAMEDANPACSRMLNRFSHFIERDLFVADPTKNDG